MTGRASEQRPATVVVGGSLVGLSAAAALARTGTHVVVLERGPEHVEGGGGLGVDVELLRSVTGQPDGPPVCRGPDRDTTAWHLLRDWLLAVCRRYPEVTVHHDTSASGVGQDRDGISVETTAGRHHTGDFLVGADGVHSTVRRHVDPEHPAATYAGFVLWRAMVDEAAVAGHTTLPSANEPSRELYAGPYRLVTYLVPGRAGETDRGTRRLNMVWYDPAREDLLRQMGKLDGMVVEGSLGAEDLPEGLLGELRSVASHTWPPPWREALGVAIETRQMFGTPVAEYLPRRLVAGRALIAGDAGHAATPMVGGGFRNGVLDAAALAASVEGGGNVEEALATYERSRLAPSVRHVLRSQRASREYLRRVGGAP